MKVIRIDTFFFQLSLLLGVVLLLEHVSAVLFDWYYIFPNLDIPMHILGGSFIASLFFMITSEMNTQRKLVFGLMLLGIVSFGVEVIEWIIDTFIRTRAFLPLQLGYWDTVTDIINNFIGGILLFCFAYFTKKI